MEQQTLLIKRTFRDKNARKLVFDKNYLAYEVKPGVTERIGKNDILEMRYGVHWIKFEVTYGREYQIIIRSAKNKIIKIGLRSYFGRYYVEQFNAYLDIIEKLWDFYFSDIVEDHLEKLQKGKEIVIGDVILTQQHLSLSVNGMINLKRIEIPWEDVGSSNFQTYFSIFSKKNPSTINRGYSYKDDWNTAVLYSTVRAILESIEKTSGKTVVELE